MKKSLLNLKGVKKLDDNQLKKIMGGYTVICYFNDGTSWTGSTNDMDVVNQMEDHCRNSPDVQAMHTVLR